MEPSAVLLLGIMLHALSMVIVICAVAAKGYLVVGFGLLGWLLRGKSRSPLNHRSISAKQLLDVESLSFLLPATLWASFDRTALSGRPSVPMVVAPRLVHA